MDNLGLLTKTFNSVMGYISAGILLLSFCVLNYMYESLTLSLLNFVLPFIVFFWGCILLFFTLINLKNQYKNKLVLLLAYTLLSLSLWPPFWILRSSPSMEYMRAQSKHESPISVITWNLQRMGDLGLTATARRQARQHRLSCIKKSLKNLKQEFEQPVGIYAFQEVSNKNLKLLEQELGISCQHIVYRSLKHAKSGLGLCVHEQADWRLNYVRKIKLKGKESWRALFGEIGHKAHTNTTFNLLNVHFRPHKINRSTIKDAIFSVENIREIAQKIKANSITQQQQAKSLLSVIKTYKDPTLLVGDFNAPPHTGTHPLLADSWDDVWQVVGQSFGVTKYFGQILPYRIDFIYALKNSFELFTATVPAVECSDHRPVVTWIALPHKLKN